MRCRRAGCSCRRPSSNCSARATCTEEVFGPILHVVRCRAHELDKLLDEIDGNGTGLTLGIHSRIDARVAQIAERLANGNVYVNRNMIGAVVGTQPFGGTRLFRHRAESRRAELSAALCHRAGGDDQHRGVRRQCEPARGRGMSLHAHYKNIMCCCHHCAGTLAYMCR